MSTPEEPLPVREPSEYRLSAVRALPTIVEENAAILSPSDPNQNFNPLASTTSPPLVLGKWKRIATLLFCVMNIHHYLFCSYFR